MPLKSHLKFLLFTALLAVSGNSIYAAHSLPSFITWLPKEFTCPIDKQKNTFMVVNSYGSYIYNYPSKYQWLFFPNTAHNNFYMCKKCYLTTYMWDFDKVPKEKLDELRAVLANVKVSKKFKKYTEISVSERLEVMQKVYSVWKKNESWWERFHRIKGYHYGAEGKAREAAESRRKSLEMIRAELKHETSKTPKKLLLYISASMKHFLADDDGAIQDLMLAQKTKYTEEGLSSEKQRNAELGLNRRITDYIERIKGPNKPRLKEREDHNGH